jgi:PAS domain-containing protein
MTLLLMLGYESIVHATLPQTPLCQRLFAEQRAPSIELEIPANLQDFFATSLDGYIIFDRTGAIGHINMTASEFLGFRSDELIGSNIIKGLPLV